ncbi:MAG: hypothetical protein IPK87_07365 [Planctomycetes bacterium]|nr:hypothetical protein [Planctomycetota bacterium]
MLLVVICVLFPAVAPTQAHTRSAANTIELAAPTSADVLRACKDIARSDHLIITRSDECANDVWTTIAKAEELRQLSICFDHPIGPGPFQGLAQSRNLAELTLAGSCPLSGPEFTAAVSISSVSVLRMRLPYEGRSDQTGKVVRSNVYHVEADGWHLSETAFLGQLPRLQRLEISNMWRGLGLLATSLAERPEFENVRVALAAHELLTSATELNSAIASFSKRRHLQSCLVGGYSWDDWATIEVLFGAQGPIELILTRCHPPLYLPEEKNDAGAPRLKTIKLARCSPSWGAPLAILLKQANASRLHIDWVGSECDADAATRQVLGACGAGVSYLSVGCHDGACLFQALQLAAATVDLAVTCTAAAKPLPFSAFEAMPSLDRLTLVRCRIAGQVEGTLNNLKKLRYLSLDACEFVEGQAAPTADVPTRIETVELSRNRLSSFEVSCLVALFPTVRQLLLNEVAVNKDIERTLKAMNQLNSLSLVSCRFEDDVSVRDLAAIKSLRKLVLNKTPAPVEDVEAIAKQNVDLSIKVIE